MGTGLLPMGRSLLPERGMADLSKGKEQQNSPVSPQILWPERESGGCLVQRSLEPYGLWTWLAQG